MKTRLPHWLKMVLLMLAPLSAQAFSVDQGAIHDTSGRAVQLRGVNWFGFETADHIVHGLWARNWKDMIAQIKAVGFNAVRIPICPATLAGAEVNSVNAALNPDLTGKNSLQVLDAVLGEFDRQGLYILLDHHRLDCNGEITELWYNPTYPESQWINDLAFMAGRYKNLPHFIGIDLKNEPHGAATWGLGNPATDWNSAAEKAARAVLNAAPETLIFVEGIQDNPTCSGPVNHWWGGNLEPLACTPLTIPANRLVLSPHVYGPDVYNQPYFNAADFPKNLPAIWDAHFGQFRAAGYAIAIGETGGRYGHGGDPKDRIWQDALIDFLIQRDIQHLFYWSWNPNSGDTGGILQDDWKSVWPDKIDLLNRLWGGTSTPAACADDVDNDGDGLTDYPSDPGCSAANDHDESNLVPPSGLNLPAKLTISSDWGVGYCADATVVNTTTATGKWNTSFTVQGRINNLWNAVYAQSGDQVTASGAGWNDILAPGATARFGFCADRPKPQAACSDGLDNDGDGRIDYPADRGCNSATDSDETDPARGGVTASLSLRSDWGSGYCADVAVSNPTAQPVEWQVNLTVDGRIDNLWNAVYTQTGTTLTARGLDWNRLAPANGKVQFGFCAQR
ncbi:MAG: cellulase family glycosylhydrolase [Gammaproteobacteria bacterium]|jgi:endoglucanase|nr:cellulase family glycosylhydrolase [Gammaproteobacteria bacterium]